MSKPLSTGDIKEKYNHLLKRFWNGMKYLNNPEISIEDKKKWLGEFTKIGNELNMTLSLLSDLGVKYTKKQILEGF